MAYDIIRSSVFPTLRMPIWDDDEDWLPTSGGGLTISEDDKKIYIEAAVPGVDPKDVEVTFHQGTLWIKGEHKEEESKGKKFYKKALNSFSYRLVVPGEIDPNIEPVASGKNGVMTVTFAKSPKSQPKKITVKTVK